ncbi:MAG: alpha/beta hydrolase [Gammaproteobacteria bacterium]|nr:alpha/beta hydrolase [Gammaproteobacteria bacterium]
MRSLLVRHCVAAFALLLICIPSFASECVVLLHGLARTADSMKTMEARLSAEAFIVQNIDYPSRKHTVDELAEIAVGEGINKCESNATTKINFVTHSLGGILVRVYLKKHEREDIGRVVMLGPPNKGSEVVDNLKNAPGFELLNGPAGMQLGTGENDVPKSLGPVNFELGVIAGTQSINLILSAFLPNPDDGKVSVEATKVEGMEDFIVLPATHPFLMNNEAVIEQTVYFLKNGKFKKENEL